MKDAYSMMYYAAELIKKNIVGKKVYSLDIFFPTLQY